MNTSVGVVLDENEIEIEEMGQSAALYTNPCDWVVED